MPINKSKKAIGSSLSLNFYIHPAFPTIFILVIYLMLKTHSIYFSEMYTFKN